VTTILQIYFDIGTVAVKEFMTIRQSWY